MRDHDDADGGHGCIGGTGDGSEEHAGQNRHAAQTAGDIADQRVGNVDQPLRESAGIHQTAADDKERQREQREGIYAGIHVLGENGPSDSTADGNSDQQEDRHGNKENRHA